MAKNLTTGLQRGLRQSIAGGLGTGDLFSTAALDLQFARHKSLDSRVTHTRQSSATYVDGDGVIRTAVTNLLLRSEEFDNAYWSKGGTITANDALSPVGTQSADKLAGGTSNYITRQIADALVGASYTFSVWLKSANPGQPATLRLNLSAPQATPNSSQSVTTTNEWRRYSVTVASVTSVNLYSQIGEWGTNGWGPSADVHVWGAQLEESSTAGQYVKTTSAINSAPRFDHDPETGESLGLLVEESRQNLLTYSEEFNNASWNLVDGGVASSPVVTANQAIAPNGTLTADEVYFALNGGTTSSDLSQLSQTESITNGITYAASIYAKTVDGSTKIISFVHPTGATENISVTGEWRRYSIIATATSSISSSFRLRLRGGASTSDAAGIYLWGSQLEAGSFPTSYIPTEGSTVTRAADVASITGTNFSSWYRQSEGTVFADSQRPFTITSGFQRIFSINDGSGNNETNILWGSASSKFYSAIISGGAASADIGFFSQTQTISQRGVVGYKVDSFGFTANGQVPATDTLGPVPVSVNRLEVGQFSSAGQFNGTIRRLTYWPTRLSNDTLQTITR